MIDPAGRLTGPGPLLPAGSVILARTKHTDSYSYFAALYVIAYSVRRRGASPKRIKPTILAPRPTRRSRLDCRLPRPLPERGFLPLGRRVRLLALLREHLQFGVAAVIVDQTVKPAEASASRGNWGR
jgi:hypothetical protein